MSTRAFDDRHRDDELVAVECRVVVVNAPTRGGGDELRRRRHLHVDAVVADPRLQLVGRAVHDRAAVVEHDDVVGELIGLFEVLRREDEGGAVAHELARTGARESRGPGSRPVVGSSRNSTCGVGDEARREVEAAAHAARERLHEAVGLVGEAEQLEQLVGPAARPPLGQVVQTTDDLEVEPGAHQAVDRRLLRRDADALAHRGGSLATSNPATRGRPSVGVGHGGEDADRRGLAGAVVAQQTEDRARWHVEVEVTERPEVTEALARCRGVRLRLCGR